MACDAFFSLIKILFSFSMHITQTLRSSCIANGQQIDEDDVIILHAHNIIIYSSIFDSIIHLPFCLCEKL